MGPFCIGVYVKYGLLSHVVAPAEFTHSVQSFLELVAAIFSFHAKKVIRETNYDDGESFYYMFNR